MLTTRAVTAGKLPGLDGGDDQSLIEPFRLLQRAVIIDAPPCRIETGWQLDTQAGRAP